MLGVLRDQHDLRLYQKICWAQLKHDREGFEMEQPTTSTMFQAAVMKALGATITYFLFVRFISMGKTERFIYSIGDYLLSGGGIFVLGAIFGSLVLSFFLHEVATQSIIPMDDPFKGIVILLLFFFGTSFHHMLGDLRTLGVIGQKHYKTCVISKKIEEKEEDHLVKKFVVNEVSTPNNQWLKGTWPPLRMEKVNVKTQTYEAYSEGDEAILLDPRYVPYYGSAEWLHERDVVDDFWINLCFALGAYVLFLLVSVLPAIQIYRNVKSGSANHKQR